MKRLFGLIGALALALSLSACSKQGEHTAEEHSDGGSAETTGSQSGAGTTGGTPAEGGDDGYENANASGGEHDHHNADFPAAEATDIAKISMRDYVFVDMPATVTGPKLRVEAKNNGPSAHEIVIFDADGNEVGGLEPIPPGDSGDVSLELTAGTYEMRCQIAISATETHLDRGMKAVFAVM